MDALWFNLMARPTPGWEDLRSSTLTRYWFS